VVQRIKTEFEEDGWVVVESPNEPPILSEAIQNVSRSLDLYFGRDQTQSSGSSYDAYRRMATVAALEPNNQGAKSCLVEHHPDNGVTNERRCRYLVDAWISFIRAELALLEEQEDAGWRHVRVAQEALDQSEADFIASERNERRARIAKSGGAGTKRSAVREKFIRLLTEKKPRNGWASQAEAARVLSTALTPFIEKRHSTGMKTENLEKQLLRWLSVKGSDERNAYESARRAKT